MRFRTYFRVSVADTSSASVMECIRLERHKCIGDLIPRRRVIILIGQEEKAHGDSI